jgi:hypothetical protein
VIDDLRYRDVTSIIGWRTHSKTWRSGSIEGDGGHFIQKRGCGRPSIMRALASTGEGDVMAFNSDIGRATRWRKGQSGNAGGRPKSRLLSEALRTRLADLKLDDPAGRTYAEVVAENLIEIACSEGPGAVHAASEIADRLEGRSRQQVEFADITAELRNKSDEELRFHLQHDRWPTADELMLLRQPVESKEM